MIPIDISREAIHWFKVQYIRCTTSYQYRIGISHIVKVVLLNSSVRMLLTAIIPHKKKTVYYQKLKKGLLITFATGLGCYPRWFNPVPTTYRIIYVCDNRALTLKYIYIDYIFLLTCFITYKFHFNTSIVIKFYIQSVLLLTSDRWPTE